MKYRHRKVKREHGIIQDALGWLEELGRLPEVSDIIPGVIEVSRSPERGVFYKYETKTGCKLLLKSNGSVQEAFVVTRQPQVVRQWVENRAIGNPVGTYPATTEPKSQLRSQKATGAKSSRKTGLRKEMPLRPRRDDFGDDAWGQWAELSAGDMETPNLGDLLAKDIRRQLRELQQSLPGDRTARSGSKQRGLLGKMERTDEADRKMGKKAGKKGQNGS